MITLLAVLLVLLVGYYVFNNLGSEGMENIENDNRNYVDSSYYEGDRGGNTKDDAILEWQKNFDKANDIIGGADEMNVDTQPFNTSGNFGDENGGFASFENNEKPKDEKDPKNLYNVDNYLPQTTNDEWFQTVKEPIPIKNRSLINTVRHAGLDTIGNSNRNASRDIRGEPVAPKMIVSAFNNSSIEPKLGRRLLI